jgi:D-isomer specific 2-hydroxyacid dehydrogenase-like protein
MLIVTSDKDGAGSVFEHELGDADIVISQPFWPAYLTAERIARAPQLKLAITAGIGSDHVDLQAAIDHGITVTEVTYCNSISVAEHVLMMILSLVRNYIPSYQWVVNNGWNIADCVSRSYDLEGGRQAARPPPRLRDRLFEKGVHPKVVSEALGHTSVAFTMDVYQHLLEPNARSGRVQPSKPLTPRPWPLFGRQPVDK